MRCIVGEDSLVSWKVWRLCRIAICAYLLRLSSVLLAKPDFSLLFFTQVIDRLNKVGTGRLFGENIRFD